MTVAEALKHAARLLSPCSASPRLDAEVLLAHTLGMRRASLLARGETSLTAAAERTFLRAVNRRAEGEPVAYLTGRREFYGLDLLVTPEVLVPRPETESLVEACLAFCRSKPESLLADIGTGCGAIAVAVCQNASKVRAYATDISPRAVEVARANARRYGLEGRIKLFVGDLMEPLPERVDVLAANLPYVAPDEAEPDVATWEPRVAVFGGGEDGAGLIRRFLPAAPRYLLPGGMVVMETAYSQGALARELAGDAFPGAAVETRRDLAGYDRILVVRT